MARKKKSAPAISEPAPVALLGPTMDAIRRLLDSKDEKVALAAAELTLQLSLRAWQETGNTRLTSLKARLAALEKRLKTPPKV